MFWSYSSSTSLVIAAAGAEELVGQRVVEVMDVVLVQAFRVVLVDLEALLERLQQRLPAAIQRVEAVGDVQPEQPNSHWFSTSLTG